MEAVQTDKKPRPTFNFNLRSLLNSGTAKKVSGLNISLFILFDVDFKFIYNYNVLNNIVIYKSSKRLSHTLLMFTWSSTFFS